jgi:hypothetical protein
MRTSLIWIFSKTMVGVSLEPTKATCLSLDPAVHELKHGQYNARCRPAPAINSRQQLQLAHDLALRESI